MIGSLTVDETCLLPSALAPVAYRQVVQDHRQPGAKVVIALAFKCGDHPDEASPRLTIRTSSARRTIRPSHIAVPRPRPFCLQWPSIDVIATTVHARRQYTRAR